MVDFKKRLRRHVEQDRMVFYPSDIKESTDPGDPRTAAEIMAVGFTRGHLNPPPGAGPLASAVFDAIIMRQQVDPR